MHFVTYCLETDRSNNDSFKSNEIRAHAHPDYLNPPSASKFADATYGRIKPCENSLFFEETIPVNPFTNSDRLSVFKNLSAGNPVEATLNTKRKIDSVPLMSGIKVRGKSPILKLCLPCPTPKPFRNIPRDTSGHIATVYPFHVKDTYQLNHDIYNNNDDDNNNNNFNNRYNNNNNNNNNEYYDNNNDNYNDYNINNSNESPLKLQVSPKNGRFPSFGQNEIDNRLHQQSINYPYYNQDTLPSQEMNDIKFCQREILSAPELTRSFTPTLIHVQNQRIYSSFSNDSNEEIRRILHSKERHQIPQMRHLFYHDDERHSEDHFRKDFFTRGISHEADYGSTPSFNYSNRAGSERDGSRDEIVYNEKRGGEKEYIEADQSDHTWSKSFSFSPISSRSSDNEEIEREREMDYGIKRVVSNEGERDGYEYRDFDRKHYDQNKSLSLQYNNNTTSVLLNKFQQSQSQSRRRYDNPSPSTISMISGFSSVNISNQKLLKKVAQYELLRAARQHLN